MLEKVFDPKYLEKKNKNKNPQHFYYIKEKIHKLYIAVQSDTVSEFGS